MIHDTTKVFNYYDCSVVPEHLSHKISQEAWNWINRTSDTFYSRQGTYGLDAWQIRGYLFISYFMNPSQENLDFIMKQLYDYKMMDRNNNLEYLEFRYNLETMLRSVKKEIHQ